MTYLKLKYIEENERRDEYEKSDPEWRRIISKIENRFSELIDNIETLLPSYGSSPPNDDWTPYWIAVYEIQSEFNLPGEDFDTEYQICPNTLKITVQE